MNLKKIALLPELISTGIVKKIKTNDLIQQVEKMIAEL